MKSWLASVFCWGSCLLLCNVQGQTPSNNDVRLVHGPDRYSGTVEVYQGGTWGRVCPNGWNFASSSVICRQLGFDDVVSYHTEGQRLFVDWEESTSFTVNSLTCSGSESSLSQCTVMSVGSLPSCSPSDAAGVVCRKFSSGDFRLANGGEDRGRAEVYHSGQWAPICTSAEWNDHTLALLCSQLGSSRSFVLSPVALPGSMALVGNLSCSSSHQTAGECLDSRASVQPIAQCASGVALNVICALTESDVRIVGGPLLNAGQVEIFHSGRWNSFCASGWTDGAATVACRQLGFSGYASWFPSADGLEVVRQGSTEGFYLSTECVGDENTIFDCNSNLDFSPANCNSQRRTILVCQGTDLAVSVLSFEATLSRISLAVNHSQASTHPLSMLLRHPHTYSLTFATQSLNAPEGTVRADSLVRSGSTLQLTFLPESTAVSDSLQPFLFYRASVSLAVQDGMGPSSSERIFTPDISEGVSVAVTTTSALVSWPPFTSSMASLSGLGYNYRSIQPEGLNHTGQSVLPSSATSIVLPNLHEGATYSFLIVPSGSSLVPLPNSRLLSELETTFTTTSDVPSSQPLNFATIDDTITSSSVRLSWELPAVADRNGDITHFTLSFNASDQSQRSTVVVAGSGSPFTHTLQGLSPDTVYEVTVAAANVNGTGPETSVAVKTLPLGSPQNNTLSTAIPIIVAGVIILTALITVIIVMSVAAICLWYRKFRSSYEPNSKTGSSFWVRKPQPLAVEVPNDITDLDEKDESEGGEQSPQLEVRGGEHGNGDATNSAAMLKSSGTFIGSTPTTTNGTSTGANTASGGGTSSGLKSKEGSYDSLSPKEIAFIVGKTNANVNNSSESLAAKGEYDQSWTPYAKPLIHESRGQQVQLEENHYEGVLIAPHTYEDPQFVQYQKRASTLPLASVGGGGSGEYSVPYTPVHYNNIPGTNIADTSAVDSSNHYANTLDANELHKLRSEGLSQGDSLPYRSNSGLLDNGYATPRKFPIYDSIMGDSSVRYDVMSPDQSESGTTNGMLTSSTPIPPNGLY